MSRFRSLFAMIAIAAFSLVSSGCKEFYAALPAVIPIITSTLGLVQQIADFSEQFFKAAPNHDREIAVNQQVSRTRSALMKAQEKGEKAGSDREVDAAFDGFRLEYSKLLTECSGMPGFAVAADGEEPALGATPGSLVVPSPNAIAHP